MTTSDMKMSSGRNFAAAARLLHSLHPTRKNREAGGGQEGLNPFRSFCSPRFSGKGVKAKAGLLLATVLVLTSCSNEGTFGESNVWHDDVSVNEGRTVECVFYSQGYGGGVSCNWGDSR